MFKRFLFINDSHWFNLSYLEPFVMTDNDFNNIWTISTESVFWVLAWGDLQSNIPEYEQARSEQGKNLKLLKMRKISISWYLCQKSFKFEFNTFNFVKFDSRLVLFPSIFQFQNSFVPKKLFLCFCDNFVKIYCQNFAKTGWFQ